MVTCWAVPVDLGKGKEQSEADKMESRLKRNRMFERLQHVSIFNLYYSKIPKFAMSSLP